MFDILQHIKKIQKEYLIWICMFLLIIPKINIVQLSSYSGSGLRIDDFILLAISCFFILVAVYKQSTIFKRVEFFFFIFIGISLISLIANSIYQRGSILYVIRLFEYWIFFYVGSFVTDRLRFRQFLTVIIYLNGLVIILQYYGIIGGYANGIYVANLTRPSGLTNGAYEAPMFIAIAFLFAISLYKKNSKQLLIHYFFSNLFIFMTGARIPFLAINFLFLGHVFFKFNRIKKTFSIFLLITVLLIGFYFGLNANITKNNENVLSRITSVLTLETVDAIKVIYEISPENESGVEGNTLSDAQLKVKTGEAKHDLQDANLQADLSLMVRVNKWFWSLKTFGNQNKIYWLIGLGPGSMGNALDGGLLRIFIEVGFIGFFSFILFLLYRPKWYKHDPMLLPIMAFLIGNIFIDYYLSYKVMGLFLFILGVSTAWIKGISEYK